MLTVSIIVHGDYTHIHQALKSLFQNMNLPLTVYVTINTGSSPEATELQSAFPQALYLINEPPRGFAANHNRILRLAQTRYVALLNDDVEIPPDMINCLVTYLEDHPRMGLVTPLVQNPDKTPQLTTFSDPSLLRMIYKISGLGYLTRQGSGIRNFVIRSGISRFLGVSSLNVATESREVPVAVGVAMFVRRQAYEQAGVIDEDTRFYGEEFGWQWRLRQVGWKIAVVTDTYITHFNVDQDLQGWRLAEHRKGMLSYFYRYRPRWQGQLLRLAVIFFHSLRALLQVFINRQQASSEWQVVRLGLHWKIG